MSMTEEQLSKLNHLQIVSLGVAMAVRNEMEDFHCEHLNDDQMRELNPLVRNAIYTALCALECQSVNDLARRYMLYNMRLVPDYWEPPVLLPGFESLAPMKRKPKKKTDRSSKSREETE